MISYRIEKTIEVAGSHSLDLPYPSKCRNQHGHNWIVTVICECEPEDLRDGMVIDFDQISKVVKGKLDHKHLNDVFDFNPTAENIAGWLLDNIQFCVEVRIRESQNNLCVVTR